MAASSDLPVVVFGMLTISPLPEYFKKNVAPKPTLNRRND